MTDNPTYGQIWNDFSKVYEILSGVHAQLITHSPHKGHVLSYMMDKVRIEIENKPCSQTPCTGDQQELIHVIQFMGEMLDSIIDDLPKNKTH